MSDYLYYCSECNLIVADAYDDEDIVCEKCGSYMEPLHVNEEEWNLLSGQEKRKLLEPYRLPTPQPQPQQKRHIDAIDFAENEGKISGLSIVAFVLSFLFNIVGAILGLIDLSKKDGRKRGLSTTAVIIGGISFVISCILAILLLFGDKPQKVVNQYCEGMKKFDAVMISECLENPGNGPSSMFDGDDNEAFRILEDFLKEQAAQIKYDIVSSEVDGDRATVKVEFAYIDASNVLLSTLGEYISQGIGLAFTGA